MLSPVLFLLIAVLLPFAGFLVLVLIGKRLGAPLAGWVGSGCMAGSFVSTLLAMVKWYMGMRGRDSWGFGDRPIFQNLPWIPAGGGLQQIYPGFLDLGVYVDSLTIAVFATITLVGLIIHIFSIGFMRHAVHFSRFFAFLGLTCFAMLGLVLGGTLLHILIFWQLLSLCSALLAGFPLDKPPALNAALRTFIVHLIGDCGFLVGLGILYGKLGNVSLSFLWTTLGNGAGGHAIVLPDGSTFSTALLTLTGICLFLGAIAKSAQFPLHVWIADASAAPIPGSALICTATTAAAGVYLMGRLFPILTPDARLFIAIIGLVTLTMGALIAMAQDDLRRMLVWTAVSQFGYMMLAIGVGSWIGGLFHLMTAAFILALLFLAAGSVIAATRGEQRMSQLGGLWRKLPVTAGAFAAGVLAITGAHLLSGHYSQSIILTDAAAFASYATHMGRAWGYWLFFALPAGVVYLTAFYLARCWMLIFQGQPRNPELFQQAREVPALWGSLLALAVPTLIAGYAMNVPELLSNAIVETQNSCNEKSKFTAFDQAWRPTRPSPAESKVDEPLEGSSSPSSIAHARGETLAFWWVSFAWIIGIALGAAAYRRGYAATDRLVRRTPLRYVHAWLYDGMYFDELYYWTLGRAVQGLSLICHVLDRYIVGATVDGIARMVNRLRQGLLLKK